MRNLPVPSRNECKDHLVKSIYTYNYKGPRGHELTEEDIKSVIALYNLYDQKLGVATDELKAATLAESLKETIKTAYGKTYEGGALHSIRTALFANVDKCPICGIQPVTELDHHLPESQFRALAIYTRNLVPLCSPCNKKKLAYFGEEGGNKASFIHAYFDALPDAQFIKAKVDLTGKSLAVEFDVDHHPQLSQENANRISQQIKALNLNARYSKEINTYLTGHAVTMHTLFSVAGKTALKGWLKATAAHAQAAYYPNYWTSVLLDGLASHDEFIDGGFIQVFPVHKNIIDDFLGNGTARI